MRLILKEDVESLGKVGDQVLVKAGHARNFLIPFGKAVAATKDNIQLFEEQREVLEKAAADKLAAAKKRAEQLSELTVSLEAQCSDEGKLYGSVGPRDVAEVVTKAGVELSSKEVDMSQGPIRHIGEYPVKVILHSQVTAQVTVNVVAAASL